MSTNSLTKRTETAFRDPEKVNAEEHLKTLQALIMKSAENIERLSLILFAIISVILLFDSISKFPLFGIELKSLYPIYLLLPVALSYIYFDFIANVAKIERQTKIFKVIMRNVYKPIYDSQLMDDLIFLPSLLDYKFFPPWIIKPVATLILSFTVAGPFILEVCSIYLLYLFTKVPLGSLNYSIIIYLGLTLFFTIQGTLTLIHFLATALNKTIVSSALTTLLHRIQFSQNRKDWSE